MKREDEARLRIAVVDDHKLFSTGFAMVLGAPPLSAEVSVFESPDALFAARKTGAMSYPDIVALDMFIPGFDALETIRDIRRLWPDAAVLMVSGSISPGDRTACLDAGASAFVSKSADPDLLRNCILELAAGRSAPVTEDGSSAAAAAALTLSPRQMEIMLHVAAGLSNKEIAALAGVSPETVKTHMQTIFRKLGARNRLEAIEIARKRGLA